MENIGARKNIYGNDWGQKAGLEAFPILIQMAIECHPPITYGKLADKLEECGIEFNDKGRRGLLIRHALGCILRTLFEYHQETGMYIPYLTIIVVNKSTGQPTYFSGKHGWTEEEIQVEQRAVYEYEYWNDVSLAIL